MKQTLLISFVLLLMACSSTTNPTKRNAKEENIAKDKFGMEAIGLDESTKNKTGLSHGVVVTNVFSFYPASKAGILKGDVIVSFNDQTIFDIDGFKEVLRQYKYSYGQVTLGVSRDNKIQKIKVHLN